MALPTLEKTWTVLPNQMPTGTSNPELLVKLVSMFLSFPTSPWTVVQCCYYTGSVPIVSYDGVNYWSNPGALLWSNRYYGTDPGSLYHTWIVLRNSGFGYDILMDLDCDFRFSSYERMQLFVSPGGFPQNGGSYWRPTATDEITILSRSVGTAWTPQATGTNKLHGIHSTDGKQTRIFIHRAGSKISSWLFDELLNTPPGVTWPVSIWAAPAQYPSLQWDDIRDKYKFYAKGNGLVVGTVPATEMNYTNYGSYEKPIAQQYSGAVNGFTGNYGMTPVWLYSFTSGARGRLGRIADMWVGSQAVAEGDTYPSATPNFVQFGHLVHPWDGVTTPQTT